MNAEIIEYLNTQRVCVVSTVLADNTPHAATVHFSHTTEPFSIIIQTNPNSKKATCLTTDNAVKMSVVIGTSEDPDGNDQTFQLLGEAAITPNNSAHMENYLEKFPEKQNKWPDDIFIRIQPVWWRFTDWSVPTGRMIIESKSH